MNEDERNAGQVLGKLGDLSAPVVFNRAAITHIDSFTRDDLLDKNKPFDDELWNEDFSSRSEAYTALSIESTKKHKANVTRQFGPGRSLFRTRVVFVTDKDASAFKHAHIWR